ncbi:Apoptosis regulatory protein Siva [Merluccius polli]|uniref:Apoptosis regulatory protein Siva n=1 Tax=Merluccius polli TaxID=89951 RepID=A0AA47M285_MERPO|nr:Apoptosis regulatory protein Siva [Merluccius polli]
MPKRSCPFSESFSSQYKVHVGQRELSQHGVFGGKYRQEIYEKTKTLLFNGASAVMGTIWKADGGEKCTGAPPPAPTQSLLKGQTLIGQDGRLTKANCAQGGGVAVSSTRCGVCQKSQGVDVRTACSQCDRLSCSSCSRQCSSCSSQCCSVCTVVE